MAGRQITIHLTDDQQKQILEATGNRVAALTLEAATTGQLSDHDLDEAVGGLQYQFNLVAVKTISW